jgi:hypothetical protein
MTFARFPLLPDEDPAEYEAHRKELLAELRPRDTAERHEAERVVQAFWRQIRADRLEVLALTDLFAVQEIEDKAEAKAASAAANRAMGTMLRYRARVEHDLAQALAAFHALRRRPARTSEPERVAAPAPAPAPARPSEPGAPARSLNRHERRRLAALARAA